MMKEGEPNKWDLRFLDLAYFISTFSKDPSTKTGAVITDRKNRLISVGYNGFPRGVKDLPERYNNRELKYRLIVHCEINAMSFANRSLDDCVLYTYPFMSCDRCAGPVIQSGIRRVVAPYSDNPRWKDNFEISKMLFDEAGVEVSLLENFFPGIKVMERK